MILISNIYSRSDKESFERGVLSDQNYEHCQKRSIISLKMCFLGSVYETTANIISAFQPYLKYKHGVHNTYFIETVLMFVVIPFLYLLNNEDTKEIIYNENWVQGMRHVIGIYIARSEENRKSIRRNNVRPTNPRHIRPLSTNNHETLPLENLSSRNIGSLSPKQRFPLLRRNSLPNFNNHLRYNNKIHSHVIKRRHSRECNFSKRTKLSSKNMISQIELHNVHYVLQRSDSLDTLHID